MHGFLSDTIVAIATPPGNGGIGVLRLSGKKAREILVKAWSGKAVPQRFQPRCVYFGNINDENGSKLDDVLVTYFVAPKSYTGEEVVEISAHGSPVVLKKMLQSFIAAGARLAEPGEFTKRAFLNGKLDLSQAEAVASLIHATSEQAANAAREQLSGKLSAEVEMLHTELTHLRAFVEATIDFPEDDIEIMRHEKVGEQLSKILQRLEALLASYQRGRLLKEGLKVVLVGQPNVGKSSLLNLLAGIERAIVHHVPGTTRDVIDVTLELAGFPVTLVDTAGIREAQDHVEQIGIARSREALQSSDLVLLLADASIGWTKNEADLLAEIQQLKKQTLIIWNKVDLENVHEEPACHSERMRRIPCLDGVLRFSQDDKQVIRFSTLTKAGLEELFQELEKLLRPQSAAEGHGVTVTELRHKNALEAAKKELLQAHELVVAKNFPELIAQHLRASQSTLAQIVGKDMTEDVLNAIFSQFCIGK